MPSDDELQGLKHSNAPATQADLHAIYRVSRSQRDQMLEWSASIAMINIVCTAVIVGAIVFAPILQRLAMEALPK